jgi:hypothetical protein
MSGFSQESYEHLGYDKQQISGLYLAQPLTEYSYEDFPGRCTVFIYPVMNYENRIIGILNAGIDAEGRNTYDFGKTFYCDLLNELTEESETLSLISTRSSIWAINEKSELTLLQDFFLDELVIPEVTFKEVVMVNNKKINLTENKIFIRSEDGKNSILANSAPDSESGPDIYTTAASEQNLNIPLIPNAAPGKCWASSLASMILFKITLPMSGTVFRDYLYSNAVAYTDPSGQVYDPGTSEYADYLLDYYLPSLDYNYSNSGWPSMSVIKSLISSSKPFYANWQCYGVGGHATVICGYNTDMHVLHSVYMMDPNYPNYRSLAYGSTFMLNSSSYSLYGTVK